MTTPTSPRGDRGIPNVPGIEASAGLPQGSQVPNNRLKPPFQMSSATTFGIPAGRLHELTALPRLLLLAADDGLQRSTDDGATWELARNTRAACAVSAFPAASSAQCAGLLRTTSGHPALIGSQDGGRTWFPAPIAAPLDLRQIKLAPLTIFGIEGTGALLRAPWQTPADSPTWFVLSDELPPVFGIGWSE